METVTLSDSPRLLRWVTFLAACALCAFLVMAPALLPSFAILVVALAVYGWMVLPAAGSVTVNLLAAGSLLWIWAVRHAPLGGLPVSALGVLLGAGAWQQRRRFRRLQRLQQVVDELREEQTVKEQAIAQAGRARDALQKKLSRYAQLQTIAEELSSLTDRSAVAELAVLRAFTLIGKSDVCLLFLVDPEQQELSLFASKKREALAPIRAKHGDQFDRHVLRAHRPLLVNDVRRDFRFTTALSAADREVSSVIACPLVLGQSPTGVLRLDSTQAGIYTQDDLRFLGILLDLVAAALTNAQLFAQIQRLAVTDGLTGLSLRRPLLEQLARELIRASRSREPIAVLMLDVDHFKEYNDTFGHTAGDLILKGVAEVLKTVVPPGGVAGRYGGEEFIVLLPRVPRAEASEVAEKIRRLIAEHVKGNRRLTPLAVRGPAGGGAVSESSSGSARRQPGGGHTGGGTITVSIGVAAFPDDAQVDLELIRTADQRLYQAKRAGRNCVISS